MDQLHRLYQQITDFIKSHIPITIPSDTTITGRINNLYVILASSPAITTATTNVANTKVTVSL